VTKPVFLLDVDEVLAAFVPPAIVAISQVLGRPWSLAEAPADEWDMFSVLTEDEYDEVCKIIDVQGFVLDLEPCAGAKQGVSELWSRCDIVVVTRPRHTPYWAYERVEWLVEHFGFLPTDVVFAADKWRIDGDFLLDDHPDNVRSWQAAHPKGLGMFWTTEHNLRLDGHDDIRVPSWSEVISLVDNRCALSQTG